MLAKAIASGDTSLLPSLASAPSGLTVGPDADNNASQGLVDSADNVTANDLATIRDPGRWAALLAKDEPVSRDRWGLTGMVGFTSDCLA